MRKILGREGEEDLRSEDHYMNQSQFADFLKDNGLHYDRAKLNMYVKRGIIPEHDFTVYLVYDVVSLVM